MDHPCRTVVPNESCSIPSCTSFHLRALLALLGCVVTSSFIPSVTAAEPRLAWAKRAGGGLNDEANAIAVDRDGNTLVAGFFRQTSTFGAGDPNPVQITALGQDLFVAKYSPAGALVWVRQARSQAAWAAGVGADAAGNCYLFGHFGPTITFATGSPQEQVFNAAANDLILAKYDKDGNFLWAKKAGGSFSETSRAMKVDSDGNCYITGGFGSTSIVFGEGQPNQTVIGGIGGNNGEDVFVAKYDSNGVLQWAKSAGGGTGCWGAGIAIDGAGNVYLTGKYSTTATFGSGEPNSTTLTSPLGGNDEIFVAKYLADGRLAWAKSGLGGAEHDQGTAIAVDNDGNSYATGFYRSKAPFGGELNQVQLDNGGKADIFVVKHNTAGELQWVRMVVGPNDENATGIAVDNAGICYLIGYGFYLGFGADEDNELFLSGKGQNDTFLAKFASDGTFLSARFDGGTGEDRSQSIVLDGVGGIYLAGRFGQTARFGEGQQPSVSITASGATDAFVAKFAELRNEVVAARFLTYQLLQNGNPALVFLGSAGQTYNLERASSLAPLVWKQVGQVLVDGEGQGRFEDLDPGLAFPAFYRATTAP